MGQVDAAELAHIDGVGARRTLSTSHTRALRSADAVASKQPLPSTVMSATGASCGFHERSSAPVATSQRLVVRLRDAAYTLPPSRVKHSAVMGSLSPAIVRTCIINIPQPTSTQG